MTFLDRLKAFLARLFTPAKPESSPMSPAEPPAVVTAPTDYSPDDLRIMAKTIWGEARGEDRAGQEAVAWVIRNRAHDTRWAGDLLGRKGAVSRVCLQPWQFSCWNDTDPNHSLLINLSDDQIALQREIALAVLSGAQVDPTGGAQYYFNPSVVTPSWANGMTKMAAIGHHDFYRG